jgi:hypothetical protein
LLTRGLRRLSGAWWLLAALGLLAAFFAVASGPAAAIGEVEPNGNLSSAMQLPVTGSYTVFGSADSATDTADFYQWTLESAAVVDITLTSTWGCSGSNCETVAVYEINGSPLIDPFGDPMGGDGAYFSGLSGASYYLRVTAGSPGGAYELGVTFYPFTYIASQHVDVAAANSTSAIVAFAHAQRKSSVHPYDLQVEGDGVYYGYSLKLFVVNVAPLDLTIDLRSGQRWMPEDGRFTGFVVTRDQFISVPAWSYADVEFIAVSESPYGWIPGDPSVANSDLSYYIGPMAAGDLLKITDETDRGSYAFQAEQIAVWAQTAGQDHNDIFNIGGSFTAENEAKRILDRAGVHTALNPTLRTNWLGWVFTYWPFCFGLFFIGIPLLFGISQALRAVRIRNWNIDGGYGGHEYAQSARFERREYIRQAREREKERARERREARHMEADHLGTTTAPVPAPVVAKPAAPSEAPVNTAYSTFMAMDAEEHFDLDGLNGLDFNAVLAEAIASKENAAACSKKAERLLARLHQDISDPDTIDDILRDRMVRWYRDSPKGPAWSNAAPRAWSGLVAETKSAGGRKRTPLEKRFADLKTACDARGAWIKPRQRAEEAEPWRRKGQVAPSVPDAPVMKAEIVQCVLDDMAASPKPVEGTFPLPVLSELAAKYTTQRINNALAEIFKADPRGPYVVIHPSRYPDCDITVIRPPAQGAKAGAMAYEIFFAKAQAQATMPQTGGPGGAYGSTGGSTPGLLDTSGALWTRDALSKEEWAAVLAELNRSRDRLEPPPPNYRKLPPYFTLRELLITDEAARRAFSSVKWRGKPVGLALLNQLLLDKTLTPDIDTDREYFEAELGDLDRGDVNYQSPTGKWTVAGGTVVTRTGDASKGFTYSV